MIRRNVRTKSGKMLVILQVPVSEEVGYMYLTMTESFSKSCCWNGFRRLWNVRTRLQDGEKSTYVDGVSELSGMKLRTCMFGKLRKWQREEVSYS
jgi:hypothetical protein